MGPWSVRLTGSAFSTQWSTRLLLAIGRRNSGERWSAAACCRRHHARTAMIEITDRITLDEAEIVVTFIRASGPGGQNVNKVSSAAQLRFDVRCSPSLPDTVRLRLERIPGVRLTKNGEIVLTAGTFRTQEANRKDAIGRLVRMIRQAANERPVRRPTRPTLGSKQGEARRGETPAAPSRPHRRLTITRW